MRILLIVILAVGVVVLGVFLWNRRQGEPPPPPGEGTISILACGDSITAASYPRHLERILQEEGWKVQVANLGRRGDTSGQYLSYLDKRQVLSRYQPDYILLQLGTNDIRIDGDHTSTPKFKDNMLAIIARMKACRNREEKPPAIFLATIPPMTNASGSFNENSVRRVEKEINPMIREIAGEEELAVVDNYELFHKKPELMQSDKVHPNQEGYKALAESWAGELRRRLSPKKGAEAGASRK